MKIKLIFLVFSISFLILPFSDAFSQNSGNLPSVSVTNVQRAPLETSDVIVLDLSVKNNGNKPLTISSSSIVLVDSKPRIFEQVSSFDLSNQDEVSILDLSCEFIFYDEIQPGIRIDVHDLCFQVPKERNLTYKLLIAESNYEWCFDDNPYLSEECRVVDIGKIPISAIKAEELTSSDEGGGCLIATAAYGTELAPEVQNLREIRNKMYETEAGGELMHAINDFYYSFSPTVADWERENVVFKETVRLLISPSLTSFTILDHQNIDSEDELIGYVIGVVTLNVGMYVGIPAIVVIGIRKKF